MTAAAVPGPPAEEPRAFVDVEVITDGKSARRHPFRKDSTDRLHWRELRAVRLDGTEYAIPKDSPVLVETTAGGPQLVTITFFAGDVRFVDRAAGEEAPE